MGELDTYALIDFMPMEPEVWLRLFVRQNQGVWPAQLLTLALGGLAIWLAWQGRGRSLGIILGACWGWVGWTFLLGLFAELNWAAVYAGWAFVVQGVLLAGWGVLGRLDRPGPAGVAGRVGLIIALAALVPYPLYSVLGDRSWLGIETFGTTPDPTALLTLGLLLTIGRLPWLAAAVPVLWCGFSGLTWLAMNWSWGLVVPGVAVVFLVVAAWRAWT